MRFSGFGLRPIKLAALRSESLPEQHASTRCICRYGALLPCVQPHVSSLACLSTPPHQQSFLHLNNLYDVDNIFVVRIIHVPYICSPMARRLIDHQKMKRLRRAAKLSQAACANAAGLSAQQAWNRIESGTATNVTVKTLYAIASVLRCDPCDLLVRQSSPTHPSRETTRKRRGKTRLTPQKKMGS
jgi:DNA-binding Xre family transcriptional regulator